ncbi:hypothetical protein P692DRAFT_20642251, partial [Suillus brevipes Sb2]
MSDITPSQSMNNPCSQTIPELRYDSTGNVYAHVHLGDWRPHPGIAQHVLITLQQHAAAPLMHRLTTPANFSQPHFSPPLSPPGSRLALSSAYQDPARIPLPDSPDRDLCNPSMIAKSHRYTPAIKTGGAHRKTVTRAFKGKGKDKENTNVNGGECPQKHAHIPEDDEDDLRAKHGRPHGSNNYSSADVKALLDLVKDELPLGQKGWQVIHLKFMQWASHNEHPHCKAQSLETKFKQFVKTTKPTGDGVCPPDVTRAHELDVHINERAGTRDLNNSDYDMTMRMTHLSRLTRATWTDAPVPHRRGAAASELLSRISGAFNPAVQQAQDEDCATRTLANMQLLAQGQQLRDANAITEKLRTQLFELQTRLYDTERQRDLTQLCLEMTQQIHQPAPNQATPKSFSTPKPKQADYTYYPDGGQCVIWHSDPET